MSCPRLAEKLVHPRTWFGVLLSFFVCLAAVAALAGPVAAAPAPASGRPVSKAATIAVPSLPTPGGLPAALEDWAAYVPQNTCDPVAKAGTLKLADLLVSTYPNTTYNTTYACGTDGGVSEHYDGRAIDWMNSIRNPTQAAQANAVLHWLFAKDSAGNTGAMFRRLGIMYIVWDDHIWGSWNQRWDPYNNCAATPQAAYDNACHRNHMHISLSWEGARGVTSYWSRQVAPTDYGPCVADGMNVAAVWSAPRSTPCPAHRPAVPPAGASPLLRQLYAYSGTVVGIGSSGTVVSVIQQAVGFPATGQYTAGTRSAVAELQRAYQLRPTGTVDVPTWQALLESMDPITVHVMTAGPPTGS